MVPVIPWMRATTKITSRSPLISFVIIILLNNSLSLTGLLSGRARKIGNITRNICYVSDINRQNNLSVSMNTRDVLKYCHELCQHIEQMLSWFDGQLYRISDFWKHHSRALAETADLYPPHQYRNKERGMHTSTATLGTWYRHFLPWLPRNKYTRLLCCWTAECAIFSMIYLTRLRRDFHLLRGYWLD